MWVHNGNLINFGATKGRMQAQEKHQEYGMESKLTIFRVNDDDYGIYNCSATNEFGNDSMIAELKELTFIEQLVHYGGGLLFSSFLLIAYSFSEHYNFTGGCNYHIFITYYLYTLLCKTKML